MDSSEDDLLSSADSNVKNSNVGQAAPKKRTSNPVTTDGQIDVTRRETVIFGDLKLGTHCACRQYLLPLNSSAMRTFFSDKDCYIDAALDADCELELTRQIATLKNTEWPKYQLIEIRSLTEESLEKFEHELIVLNPAFKERLPFDADKYKCTPSSCRMSMSLGSESGMSSADEEGSNDDAVSRDTSKKRKKKRLTKEKAAASGGTAQKKKKEKSPAKKKH